MIKKLAFSLALVAALSASASADTGIFGSYVVINTGSGDTFYDLTSSTSNPDFSTLNGSVFGPGTLFQLDGGELNTFKNNGTTGNGFNDIGTPSLLYSVIPGGVDSNFQLGFDSQFPDFGNNTGDQKWQTLGQNINLLANLAPGNYTLNVRITAPTGTNGDFSGGALLDTGTFSANFTVVPEPSSLSLLAGPAILGAWFFVRRRRA